MKRRAALLVAVLTLTSFAASRTAHAQSAGAYDAELEALAHESERSDARGIRAAVAEVVRAVGARHDVAADRARVRAASALGSIDVWIDALGLAATVVTYESAQQAQAPDGAVDARAWTAHREVYLDALALEAQALERLGRIARSHEVWLSLALDAGASPEVRQAAFDGWNRTALHLATPAEPLVAPARPGLATVASWLLPSEPSEVDRAEIARTIANVRRIAQGVRDELGCGDLTQPDPHLLVGDLDARMDAVHDDLDRLVAVDPTLRAEAHAAAAAANETVARTLTSLANACAYRRSAAGDHARARAAQLERAALRIERRDAARADGLRAEALVWRERGRAADDAAPPPMREAALQVALRFADQADEEFTVATFEAAVDRIAPPRREQSPFDARPDLLALASPDK